MPTYYPYETTLVNEYLGKSKVIRARTQEEFNLKVWEQRRAWSEQEAKKREQEAAQEERERKRAATEGEKARKQAHLDSQRQKAADRTAAVTTHREQLASILKEGLGHRPGVDWASLEARAETPAFRFDERPPTRPVASAPPTWAPPAPPPPVEEALRRAGLDAPLGAMAKLVPGARRRREDEIASVRAAHRVQMAAYESRLREAREAYERARQAHTERSRRGEADYARQRAEYDRRLSKAHEEHRQAATRAAEEAERQNAALKHQRAGLGRGDSSALEWYLALVLQRHPLPARMGEEFSVAYDPHSQTAVVSRRLPIPDDMPSVVEFRYVQSRDEIQGIEAKPKEQDQLYESVIHQIALRTMHEVLSAPDASHMASVVFNGIVTRVNPKTGKSETYCILSCQAARQEFAAIDLGHVDPKECLRGLKALSAGPLAEVAPVRPILELDREDSRLVASREVLGELSESDNLAAMDWEDFEHLVRELFEREFGGEGAEVRVTRASRDQGVDAIAFDPDPIRGGKFVIQAKRYNIVVPVAAVRDLYGTMINEGAARGILVTTSWYGADARDFAKDKPLTLIDGANLVHMLQKHGYKVHIETGTGA